jgi:hypothetical protein
MRIHEVTTPTIIAIILSAAGLTAVTFIHIGKGKE